MQRRYIVPSLIMICSLVLGACTHQQPPTLTRGATLMIVTDSTAGTVDPRVEDKLEKAGKGTAMGIAGTVGGVAAGGLAGAAFGLACGPAAILCIPVAAIAGAGTGGVVGGVAGAQYGGVGGVPVEKAKSFNRVSEQLLQREQVMADLERIFHKKARRNWQLSDESPNQVTLRLLKLDFEQPGKERLRIRLSAQMEANIDGRKRMVRIERANPPVHVDQWLDDGQFLAAELEKVLNTTVQALVTSLVLGA